MSPWRRFLLLITFAASLLGVQNAFAFRCDGGLVSEGDAKLSVLNKCGEPLWIDRWAEEIIEFPDSDNEHRIKRVNERWVYNPGPTQFLRIITFRDGRVLSIQTGSRGFSAATGMQRCDFNTLSLDSTSAEVAAKCGAPDMKEQRSETITSKIPGGRKQISVSVEEWSYNLGPTHFIRILTFRNGNLEDIRTGEKGFK